MPVVKTYDYTDECNHPNIQYYYQCHFVGTEKRRHWFGHCTECGDRIGNPWCKKPPLHLQKSAIEFKRK